MLGLGAFLRILTMIGYRPALWFPDSYTYVVTAMRLRPDLVRPAGYPIFLRLLEPLHSFAVVTFVQHLLGLAVGVMVYLTVLRRGAPAWAGILASVPVLLDAYQIELEHLLVSDSLFTFLIVAAACLTLTRAPSPWTAAAVGLLLAAATLTRTVGLPLIAVFAFFLLWYGYRDGAGRTLRRSLVAFLLAALVPIGAYGGWFYATNHRVGLVGANGVFLYSRTMAFADCAVMKPPPDVAVLCDPRPPESRPPSQEYIWDAASPLVRLPGITFTRETDTLAGRFAWLAIRSQPLDYAGSVLSELGRSFADGRPIYPNPETYGYYEFPATVPPPPGRHPAVVGKMFAERYEQGSLTVRIAEPYAAWMRAYQKVAFMPGSLLLAVLLVPPAVAGTRAWSRRKSAQAGDTVAGARAWSRRKSSQAGGSAGNLCMITTKGVSLTWVAALVLLVVPPATAEFDYRYVLPVVPLACLAAAIAIRPVLVLEPARDLGPQPIK